MSEEIDIRLDLEALAKKNHRIISSEDALKDVAPIDWTEDVLNGKKKVIIKKAKGSA